MRPSSALAFSPGAAGPLLCPESPLDWQLSGACQYTDPDLFFPGKGGSTREAKAVCRGCEVRADCLEYALGNDERFGIWGGLSGRERRKVARHAVASAAPLPGRDRAVQAA